MLELELEARLSAQFPLDTITPVPKGEFGGDTVHTVCGPLGQPCGVILWESKRTKTWSDGWLQKLKDNQRAAKADLAVIVTPTLPKNVDTFDLVDGVWVTSAKCALPVAVSLRHTLIELARMRQTRDGQETKAEMLYEYITGTQFRQRMQAIVESFSSMKDDLAREKRAIQTQWAKREKQLERVLTATAGMFGDSRALPGKASRNSKASISPPPAKPSPSKKTDPGGQLNPVRVPRAACQPVSSGPSGLERSQPARPAQLPPGATGCLTARVLDPRRAPFPHRAVRGKQSRQCSPWRQCRPPAARGVQRRAPTYRELQARRRAAPPDADASPTNDAGAATRR